MLENSSENVGQNNYISRKIYENYKFRKKGAAMTELCWLNGFFWGGDVSYPALI